MKPYDLIVFDWDGTVMDSEHRIVTCMQRAGADTLSSIPTDAEVREIIGLGMQEAVARLWPEADDDSVQKIIEAYRVHWLGDQIPDSELFEGAAETIEALTDRGYLLAVATGKSRRGLDRVLDESGLGRYFHMTRCADEAHSKPHPQMLQDILTDLNTEPNKALVVGDTEYDIQMATNAKVDAVGVSYGAHDQQRLLDCGAKTILHSLTELIDWLETQ